MKIIKLNETRQTVMLMVPVWGPSALKRCLIVDEVVKYVFSIHNHLLYVKKAAVWL